MAKIPFPLLSCLAGALLITGAASDPVQAQQRPAIVPNGAPPVPAPVAESTRPVIDSLSFQDIDAAELLNIIAREFGVQIAIAGDVTGQIRSVNLTNMAPETAIQTVAMAGGLRYQRTNSGVYVISKAPLDAGALAPASSQNGVLGAITDANSTPGAALGFGAPFPGAQPGTIITGPLGIGGATPSIGAGMGLPELVGTGSAARRSRQHTVRVRNVKPSIVAYWLDPVNQPIPEDFRLSDSNARRYGPDALLNSTVVGNGMVMGQSTNEGGALLGSGVMPPSNNPYVNRANGSSRPETRAAFQFGGIGGIGGVGGVGGVGGGQTGAAGAGGVFELPEGIERIIAVDPQNLLLVQGGTDEAIRELQAIISVLDRPLRQVEIEAQFVTLSTTDVRAFGIDFSTARGNFNANNTGFAGAPTAGSFQIGFVRGQFQATLTALLNNSRAKLITAPRVTAINNLTANISSNTSTPIQLQGVAQGGGQAGNQAQFQNVVYITTTIGLTVTPTINNDDTITVLMQPTFQGTQPSGLTTGAPIITSQAVYTVANVRNGDTIALGGLKTKTISAGRSRVPLLSDIPLLGRLFQSRNDNAAESELIIFLTARIVPRPGDDELLANT